MCTSEGGLDPGGDAYKNDGGARHTELKKWVWYPFGCSARGPQQEI